MGLSPGPVREIRPEERALLLTLYDKHHADYAADKDAATKLVGTGETLCPGSGRYGVGGVDVGGACFKPG